MSLVYVFAVFMAASAAVATIYGVRIANELKGRGIKANPWLLRLMLFKYLGDYKRVTVEETGHPGPLYKPCVAALLLTLFFAVCVLIVLAAIGRLSR